MRRRWMEHGLSIGLVAIVFVTLIVQWRQNRPVEIAIPENPALQRILDIDGLNLDDPLHRAMVQESAAAAGRDGEGLLTELDRYRGERATAAARSQRPVETLDGGRLLDIAGMYLVFLFAYAVVMALTYYGVQTLGVARFIQQRRGRTSYLALVGRHFRNRPWPKNWPERFRHLGGAVLLLLKALGRAVGYAVLFSPAYVIAYSFRTRFDTDSLLFMVLLGVISNGLLITYAQKFYTFLVHEARRGYVLTARVKNLRAGYEPDAADGIPWKAVFHPRKRFDGHVFQHIFMNARFQYLETIKEQASFLVTGLVIIEMALNIQGHLCYALLQNLLYRQYDAVLVILLGIFLAVKGTEILADVWKQQEARRYGHR